MKTDAVNIIGLFPKLTIPGRRLSETSGMSSSKKNLAVDMSQTHSQRRTCRARFAADKAFPVVPEEEPVCLLTRKGHTLVETLSAQRWAKIEAVATAERPLVPCCADNQMEPLAMFPFLGDVQRAVASRASTKPSQIVKLRRDSLRGFAWNSLHTPSFVIRHCGADGDKVPTGGENYRERWRVARTMFFWSILRHRVSFQLRGKDNPAQVTDERKRQHEVGERTAAEMCKR